MKISVIILSLLCSAAAFAGKSIAFTTVPDKSILTPQKALTGLQIRPENTDKCKFYRISMQIKATHPGEISSHIAVGKKSSWENICVPDTEWNTVYRYVSPGEAWTYKASVKNKAFSFCVRDIKVEELDDNDLTANLLPHLDNCGWHSVWSKLKAKTELVKSDDSPFGRNIFSAEINANTGYPATLAIPAVPGRTLVLEIWVKGEPDDVWNATVSRRGTKKLPLKAEWRRYEIKYKISPKTAPGTESLVFWKQKNKKKLTCTIAQIKAYYEK